MENKKKVFYINHSGGAVGADYEWSKQGATYGVVSRHYWYGQCTPYGNVKVSEEDFEEGQRRVLLANRVLHRRPERYMSLLARDYCQVKYAEAIFAIGQLYRGNVKGGTGWAVQMAIDDGKPVYLFDQEQGTWLTLKEGSWNRCEVPVLTQNFAGIGSRNITERGIQAIEAVYRKTFGEQ